MPVSYEEIIEFIKRRFPNEDKWLTGNCYWFAVILNEFCSGEGEIFYDVMMGHFYYCYGSIEDHMIYWDWNGPHTFKTTNNLIKWNVFYFYDKLQYERIIRDCIA